MHHCLLLLIGALLADTARAADFVCMEDCLRRGYARSHCVAVCDGGAGPGGMLDQPGLPRNPAFDQIDPQKNRQQQTPLPVTDAKCLEDCRRKGYNYMLCRQQCSYSLTQ